MKRVILVNPAHPYGRAQVYLNGSLVAAAAQLQAAGCEVDIIDLNLDRLDSMGTLTNAEVVGVSLTGAPDIPGVLKLLPQLRARAPCAKIVCGGQVVEAMLPEQFQRVFGADVRQFRTEADLAELIGGTASSNPPAHMVPYQPVWEQMGPKRLAQYLQTEGTLVVSQGCHFKCRFCAAQKDREEVFRDLGHFENDLRYLCRAAKQQGITYLQFYASSLDFFQNPTKVAQYLEVLAQVQAETGVQMRVRCLSCSASFRRASMMIPNFGDLLRRAGLWCVAFGADGTDAAVWRAQRKNQNKIADLRYCLDLCQDIGVRPELLMVLGFPEDTVRTLGKTVLTSLVAAMLWHAIIRPYCAKWRVPGNKGWQDGGPVVEAMLDDPVKFYNLDFAALSDRDNDPDFWHRWASNAAYLTICALLTPVGKCTTSPVLPQGHPGLLGAIAARVNRWLPPDR